MQKHSLRIYALTLILTLSSLPGLAKKHSSTPSKTTESATCTTNISFAWASHGLVNPGIPDFVGKWVEKNQKKYQGTCFSQAPVASAQNYLLVFATSASAFNGIYPVVRTNTTTDTTPVSGSGTITSNYGGMWTYTYNGTVTTTSTNSYQVNLPYTDTTNTLYLYSYTQSGSLRGRRWRSRTTRQGGDGYNTLGYNLGSLLATAHLRERLLKDSVNDIAQAR